MYIVLNPIFSILYCTNKHNSSLRWFRELHNINFSDCLGDKTDDFRERNLTGNEL